MNKPIEEIELLPPRNWEEDFGHENGNYHNTCHYCEHIFVGYKRRLVCKRCQWLMTRTPSISYGDAVEKVAMAMSELDDAQPLCKATYVQLAKTAVAAMGIEEGKE